MYTYSVILYALIATAASAIDSCPNNNEYYHSFPHENCHKFYVCDWGKPIEKICPLADEHGNRLIFNPVLQVCDWYDAAVAAGAVCPGTNPTPTPTPPSTPTEPSTEPLPSGKCPANNEYYHSYPHETDCHKFYVCDWGVSIEKICPLADEHGNRLVFNPFLQVCDWYDAAVDAGAVCPGTNPIPTPTPPPTPTGPSTEPPPSGKCPANNEYYHSYPHETDCHKFYVCDWGVPIEKICPLADEHGNRLVFNPVLQVCDWYDAAVDAGAVCPGTNPTPTPTPPPTPTGPSTEPPPSGKCPSNNEYYHSYPHETDCHKFYVCDWGVPKEKICPLADEYSNRLVFNPTLQVCDWLESAEGGGASCAA